MTSALYYYKEFEPSGNKDDHHINKVGDEEDGKVMVDDKDKNFELVEPINQYMRSYALEFEVVSGHAQYKYNN
jgi:hypothetical protein